MCIILKHKIWYLFVGLNTRDSFVIFMLYITVDVSYICSVIIFISYLGVPRGQILIFSSCKLFSQ